MFFGTDQDAPTLEDANRGPSIVAAPDADDVPLKPPTDAEMNMREMETMMNMKFKSKSEAVVPPSHVIEAMRAYEHHKPVRRRRPTMKPRDEYISL